MADPVSRSGARASLRANLEALRPRDEALAGEIARATPIPGQVRSTVDRGVPNLRVRAGAAEVPLHDPRDPAGEARRLASAPEVASASLVVVYGLGTALHLRAVAERAIPRCRIAVVEPRLDLVRAALAAADLRDLLAHPQFYLVAGEGPSGMERCLYRHLARGEVFPFANVAARVVLPGAERLAPQAVEPALEALSRAVRFAGRFATGDPADTLLGLDQTLENAPLLASAPDLARLQGRYRGVPAVCVAAGPSLEQDLSVLRGAPGRALVLAADTVLERLLAEGIRPHAVVRHERTRFGHDHYFAGRPIPEDVVLVARPVIYPGTFRDFPGPVAPVWSPLPTDEWVRDLLGGPRATLEGTSSVAQLAFLAAEALGCEPIVLVGQDLAYGPDDRAYVAGTAHGALYDGPCAEAREAVAVGGAGTVRTNRRWVEFRTWFEMHLARGAPRVVNSSRGARILGTVEAPLAEALAGPPAVPPLALAAAIRSLERADPRAGLARLAEASVAAERSARAHAVTLEGIAQRAAWREGASPAAVAAGLDEALSVLERRVLNDPLFGSIASPLALRVAHAVNVHAARQDDPSLVGVLEAVRDLCERGAALARSLAGVLAGRSAGIQAAASEAA